LKLFYKQII